MDSSLSVLKREAVGRLSQTRMHLIRCFLMRNGKTANCGDGRKSKLYVRTSVSYAHKAKVIDVYEECADLSETITRIYGELSHDKLQKKKKQIRKWLYDRANIRAMCVNGKGRMHKRRKLGDGTVLTKEAEEQIVLWINSARREGIPVSSMMLQIKAVRMHDYRTFTLGVTGRSRATQHNAQSEEACVEHLPQGLVALKKNVRSSPIGQSDVHSSLLPASSRATKRKGGGLLYRQGPHKRLARLRGKL